MRSWLCHNGSVNWDSTANVFSLQILCIKPAKRRIFVLVGDGAGVSVILTFFIVHTSLDSRTVADCRRLNSQNSTPCLVGRCEFGIRTRAYTLPLIHAVWSQNAWSAFLTTATIDPSVEYFKFGSAFHNMNSNGDFALNSCKKSAKLLIQCSLRTRYNPFENKLTSRFVLLLKLLILLSNFILNYASNTSPWLIFTLSFAKRRPMTHSKNIFKGETYLTTSLTIVLRH